MSITYPKSQHTAAWTRGIVSHERSNSWWTKELWEAAVGMYIVYDNCT